MEILQRFKPKARCPQRRRTPVLQMSESTGQLKLIFFFLPFPRRSARLTPPPAGGPRVNERGNFGASRIGREVLLPLRCRVVGEDGGRYPRRRATYAAVFVRLPSLTSAAAFSYDACWRELKFCPSEVRTRMNFFSRHRGVVVCFKLSQDTSVSGGSGTYLILRSLCAFGSMCRSWGLGWVIPPLATNVFAFGWLCASSVGSVTPLVWLRFLPRFQVAGIFVFLFCFLQGKCGKHYWRHEGFVQCAEASRRRMPRVEGCIDHQDWPFG